MEREHAEAIMDLGIATLEQFARSTATPLDDTACRFLVFFRNDPSFDSVMDRLFGDAPQPLTFNESADDELRPLFDRFKRDRTPDLTGAEFMDDVLPIIVQVLALIRKLRQAKKSAPPAAA